MSGNVERITPMVPLFATAENHPEQTGGNVVVFTDDTESAIRMAMETGKIFRVQYADPYPLAVQLDEETFPHIKEAEGLFEVLRVTNILTTPNTEAGAVFPPVVYRYTLTSDVSKYQEDVILKKAGSISRVQLEHLAVPVLTSVILTLDENALGYGIVKRDIMRLTFRHTDKVEELT